MQTKTKKQLLLTLMLSLFSMAYIVFNSVLAFADNAGMNGDDVGSNTMKKIVGWGATVAGGLVAVFLMISIVKDAISYAKGQGSTSIFKIIGKVVFMIIMIGIIFLAKNYGDLGNKGQKLANTGMGVFENELNQLTPSGD